MRKLGLIGRWALVPTAGLILNNTKPRGVQISFNTVDKTVLSLQEYETLDGLAEKGKEGPKRLLGSVDGLETFEFRVRGAVKIVVDHYDPNNASPVWYFTEEGENYAIDGEALRDFTVPMIGRRERNEELDAIRFEMRQEMRKQQAMFKEFLEFQSQRATEPVTEKEPDNGKGHKTDKPSKPKPGDGKPSPDSNGADKDGGSGVKVDPKRAVPEDGGVQQPAAESDT